MTLNSSLPTTDKVKIGLISLGCPKNLVDSENILGGLSELGYEITNSENEADVLIINTCAFIEPARKESARVIKDILKNKGDKKIVVCGCYPELEGKLFLKRFPEVDAICGAANPKAVIDAVENLVKSTKTTHAPSAFSRVLTTPYPYAYIKIADGCNNRCSYCIIPKLRGPFRSRKIEEIVEEAEALAEIGVKELNLAAQDTTNYGIDIYGKRALPKLLKKLAKVRKIEWIRVLYAHPAHLDDEALKTIAEEDKVVKYIDLPIQHISDKILKAMGRKVSKEEVENLIKKIRRRIPEVVLRTSLIAGFPGESEKEFKEILDFIKNVRFERLGVFEYSDESGTAAAKMRGKLPAAEKKKRFNKLMRLQRRISRELNKGMIGKTLKVLIEGTSKEGTFQAGRSYREAPEIDGSVLVANSNLRPGRIANVKITDAFDYDLVGFSTA